jgi:GT2 family glycosyltransferase
MRDITVVIPFRNGHATIDRLLDSLPKGLPAIVIDDMSEPPLTWALKLPKRGYFSGAVNAGLAACTTDVLVLNQDMQQVSSEWMPEIDRLRGKYAMIGDGVMGHAAWPHGYVQGTCMFLRRDAIRAVGGLNERDWPLWGATAEYQARLCRKGFRALPMDTSAWFAHGRDGKHGSAIAEFIQQDPEHADWAKRTPPMISVIIACYNYGRYLPDAIASLRGGMTSLGAHQGQTFAGWEAIIVDDCSTDDTPAIAQGLADAWQGIRYIRLPKNAGTAGAYNAGIKAAFGRYFMMLSADDMLEPTALDTMYRIVEDDQTAVAYTDLQLFRDGKRGKVWEMHEYDFDALLDRNHVPAGIMATKAAWQAVGGYPAKFRFGREDWAMAVALGRAGYCGVRVPEPLYLYRRAGQNRSATNGTAEWREQFVAQMRETFPDVYAGVRPVACCGRGTRMPARTVQKAQGAAKMTAGSRVGETGLTLIEYVGTSDGWASWWGPVTNTRYEFGGKKRIGYVDNRDVADMLNVVQGRRPVFRRYVQPETPIVGPVVFKYAPGEGPLAVASLVAQDQADIAAAKKLEQPLTIEAVFDAVADAHGQPPVEAQKEERRAEAAKPKRTRKAKNV